MACFSTGALGNMVSERMGSNYPSAPSVPVIEHVSGQTGYYYPSNIVSLEKVEVAGKAILIDAPSLQSVVCNGLKLKRSKVTGSVDAKGGDVELKNSKITGALISSGREITVRKSEVDTLVINPMKTQQETRIIKIFDSTIGRLLFKNCTIFGFSKAEGSEVFNLKYEGADRRIVVHIKNCRVTEISHERVKK